MMYNFSSFNILLDIFHINISDENFHEAYDFSALLLRSRRKFWGYTVE